MSRFMCLIVVAALLTGCTTWGPETKYGARQEIARRPLGEPHYVETSSTSASANIFGVQESSSGSTVSAGAADGSVSTIKQTRCMQTHQLDFVQPYVEEHTVQNRQLDVAMSIFFVAAGVGTYAFAETWYQSDLDYYQSAPSGLVSRPQEPVVARAGAIASVGVGLGWLAVSLIALPRGPKPPPVHREVRTSETRLIEVMGCAK